MRALCYMTDTVMRLVGSGGRPIERSAQYAEEPLVALYNNHNVNEPMV